MGGLNNLFSCLGAPPLFRRTLVNLIDDAIEASNSDQCVTISVSSGSSSLDIVIQVYVVGMPIAKKIIDSHGGRIPLGSVSGKGRVVRVELPSFTFWNVK